MNAENPTLLVAGAGDLGLRVAQQAADHQWTVIALRRQPPHHGRADIEWVQADLSQRADLRLKHRPITHVVYAATPDERTPEAYEKIFIHGLQQLIAALSLDHLQRFVFISSTAVYGPSTEVLDENSRADPQGFNGKTLLQAEQLLAQSLASQAISLRLSGLYGPHRTQLLERLRQGKAYAPIDSAHYANRIHIHDAARAVWHLLNIAAPFPCYIGTDSHPYPLAELYDELAKLLQAPPPPRKDYAEGGKRLSNQRLLNSGFTLEHPDSLVAYAELIKQGS